jgi:uncharacterized membrane protein
MNNEEVKKESNGFAITALVLGIIAFLLGWTGLIGLILGVIAVIFGIIALVKKQSKGMGITGLILGGIALVTAIIFTIIGLALLGGAAHVANEVNNEQKALESAKKDFAKGETGTFDKVNVTVATVTPNWDSGNEFVKPKDGYSFVFVSLKIKNTSTETVSVNPFDFKMDDNGVLSDESIVATTPTPLNAVELKPDSEVAGDIVYEVKTGATGLKLQYKSFNTKALKDVTYTIGL